ncbi:MAG: PLP-dependent transferase [Bacteroidia bacterium]|nr:PLP-dependent transferase [Bacteroidia bacterium]
MKFGTKALHAGIEPDPTTGAIMTPIFQTSTFVQEYPGTHKGYAYARGKNPTRTQLENNLAALENGTNALCFSSGMGAIDAVIKLLKPGDEVITGDDIYGGSYRMFSKIYEPFGIKFHYINLYDAENIRQYVNSNTKLIWAETPTNPTLKIVDISAVATIAKEFNLILAIDNTFASPYLQNPLDLGADIVMHSATKYLGGHSDVVMGALVTKQQELHDRLAFILNSCGANPGPMDCFLVIRGIKTLHLRMKAHCSNGKEVANFLRNHPKVGKVYWPGFEDAAGHTVAKKQMRDFGGMVSFTLKGDDFEAAMRFATNVKIFTLAESLGGVESLVNHPASMTHASIPKIEREKSGVVDGLLRLSVGVEDIEDLILDITQALEKV